MAGRTFWKTWIAPQIWGSHQKWPLNTNWYVIETFTSLLLLFSFLLITPLRLAPPTAFSNVCLLSLTSLHLELALGRLPDPCVRVCAYVHSRTGGNQLCICSALSHKVCISTYLRCVIEKPELWYQCWTPQLWLLSAFHSTGRHTGTTVFSLLLLLLLILYWYFNVILFLKCPQF